MKLSLSTWNGTNINNGNPFYASIPQGQLASLRVNPVLVNRADDYPALTAGVKQGSVIVINIRVAAGQDINSNRESLKRYFFADTEIHNLVALDEADSNKPYYRSGIPVQLAEEQGAPNSWFVTIQTEYPFWRLVTAASDTWSITASAQTHSITNGGNLPVRPVFTFTPGTTKTAGLKYWRYVPIYNRTEAAYTAPMEITNGGMDTDALIPAKMLTSANDLTVWMDGAKADRWVYGANTTATKVWANITLGPKLEGTSDTQITPGGTTLSFSETKSNLTFLKALKTASNYTLLIESEAVTFDPDNIDLIEYQITSLGRGKKNTTAATHAASSTVHYIDHDLFIMYGDTAASAPETDDDYKPIFDLTSTNTIWSYTNYYDTTSPNRPGSWRGEVKSSRTKLSYCYTGNENTFADPSTELGLAERAAQDFTIPHETALLHWMLTHPAGITDITCSGSKYYTGSWPGIVGVQKLQTNTVWVTVRNETAPSTTSAWEDYGPVSLDLGDDYPAVRFVIDGTLSSVINEMAAVQYDTVAVTFSTAALPVIALGSEAAINFFDFKLTNVTTGEWIKVRTPCPVSTALVVDCDTQTAYLADGRIVPVTLSSDRRDWLNLRAGANTLKFEDTGTVAVTLKTDHRDRVL